MTALPDLPSRAVDPNGLITEMMTTRVAGRRREILDEIRENIRTTSDGHPWVAVIQRAVADGQMHECIAEYLIGFYASMVASNMQETDRLSLDLELEEEAHMHRYWPEGLTEEEADAIELSEEQVAELQRRGRELDARHSARHNELELEVLRAWGGEAMVKSIGSNSDEHFERTEIGYAMVFGGEVGVAVAEVIPMWFPPTLRSN